MPESTTLMMISKAYVIVTILIALFYRKKYFDTALIFFFYWLLVSAAMDNLPRLFYNHLVPENKSCWIGIINIGVIIQLYLVLTMYYKLLKNNSSKKQVLIVASICLLIQTLSSSFGSGLFHEFNSINFVISWAGVITSVTIFIREILNSELVLFLTKYLWFWISVGLILFYVGAIPNLIVRNLEFDDASVYYLNIFMHIFNLIVYSIFNYGFIKCQMTNK